MINDPNFRGHDILYPIDLVATILSICGSICMYCLCIRTPGKLNISTKFIIAVATADFAYTISNVLSNFETRETTRLCYLEASLRHVAFVLSIFFSACLAIVSYQSTLPRNNMRLRSFYIIAITVGPTFILILTILLPYLFPRGLIMADYGPLNCSISPNFSSSKFMQFLFYMLFRGIPILLGLIITFESYRRAIREAKKLPPVLIEQMDWSIYNLLWYPCSLMITFAPSLLDQFVSIYAPNRPIWVTALRVGITHSLGFINALLYITLRGLYHNKDLPQIPEPTCEFEVANHTTDSDFSLSLKDELLKASTQL